MKLKRRHFWTVLAAWGVGPLRSQPTEAPPVMLPTAFTAKGWDASLHWVSEKYDGVRARWTGTRLLTRSGHAIHAPAWFTNGWPLTPMDGELWAGRGGFEQAVSTVRSQQAPDDAWRNIRFMVFDLPSHPGAFDERRRAYHLAVQAIGQAWVVAVPQRRVASHRELAALLTAKEKEGAEGLVVHHGESLYRPGRSPRLMKLKSHDDAEATVVAHQPGRGKHAGRLGALWVENPRGQRFKLGTGFSDAQRLNPPPVGSVVTYRYRGTTDSGLPRFASFLRIRADD